MNIGVMTQNLNGWFVSFSVYRWAHLSTDLSYSTFVRGIRSDVLSGHSIVDLFHSRSEKGA